VISIFTGTDCETLQCIAQNNEGTGSGCGLEEGRPSIANFQALGGSTYWILVEGFEEAAGTFNLVISLATVSGNISLF
jgi:hypothetical protein